MKYERILAYISSRPWAMDPLALAAMCEIIAARASGEPAVDRDWQAEGNFGGTAYMAEMMGISPQSASATARKQGRVAVLPIRGTIMHRMGGMQAMSGGTGLETLAKSFAALRDDNSVKAIVLDVDSPGGSVDGLPETAAMIRESRGAKPVVAQVNVRAASAAYWLASAADEIAVTPSGEVGSIGIVTAHQDLSAALEKAGIKTTVIASTPHKAEGNPFGPLSEEASAAITSDVMEFDTMFHDAVASGRGVKASTVRESFGQGRMVLAEESVKRGMADRVATMEQTLNRFGATMLGGSPRGAAQDARLAARRSFLRRANLVGQ